MEKCPTCGRLYQDNLQKFCVEDGAPLVTVAPTADPTISFHNQPPATAPIPQFQTMPTVQAKKKSNVLLFAGIGAALLVLLIGAAGAIIFAVKNSSDDPANTNTGVNISTGNLNANGNRQKTIVQNSPDESDKYKPELTMAIKAADDAQINAYATYDATPMKTYYMGEALKSSLAQIDQLKKAKIYQSFVLEKQDFEYFKVNDAETDAEVRVVETWSSTVYQTPSNKCVEVYKSRPVPQNIYLKKNGTGWMVNVIVYDQAPPAQPAPCPNTTRTKLEYNGGELFYTTNVTEAEAKKLGDYMVKEGFYDGTKKSVELDKSGPTYQFRMVVMKEKQNDPATISTMKTVANELSGNVFDNAPTEVHICDDRLRTLHVVKQ